MLTDTQGLLVLEWVLRTSSILEDILGGAEGDVAPPISPPFSKGQSDDCPLPDFSSEQEDAD